jgi:hypothetical protein
MENNYPFKIELQEDTPKIFTMDWEKSFKFNFIWQGKTYEAEYWWNSADEEDVEWLSEKPNFGEKENEIMEKLIEYIREEVDTGSLNFEIIAEK